MAESGPNVVAGNSNSFLDYQVRTPGSGAAVNDAARISCLRMDCGELGCTPSRPTVFTQEPSKVCPCFAFAPGVPQRPGPAAFHLDVGGRGRVDNHSDGVSVFAFG